MIHTFTIAMTPTPWKRPGQGRHGRYDLQKALKLQIGLCLSSQMGKHKTLNGIIELSAVFFMERPKYLPMKYLKQYVNRKPDLDNLLKLILDCGNKIIWEDDARIAKINCEKVYSDEPHVFLVVREIDGSGREINPEVGTY